MLNQRMIAPLRNVFDHPRLERGSDLFMKAAATMSIVYVVVGYFALPAMPIFGNDEVHYFPNFFFKLEEDGRWLNYLLNDVLRSVALPLWSVVYVSLF